MAPKLTMQAMVRRINQQFKYDPIAHVGASGLVYTAKTRLKVVSGDPIVYVIEQSRMLSDCNRGSVSKEKYAERIRAEAHNALAKIKEYNDEQ
jgi:hypothetical protein